MPAHTEMQLISRIIRTGCMGPVVEWGINANDFKTGDGVTMWTLLVQFYDAAGTRGAVLGLNSIHKDFPEFELCDDEFMTTEALCKVVREIRLIIDAKQYLDKCMEDVETEPMAALLEGRRRMDQLIELGDQSNLDVSFSDAINVIVDDYEKAEAGIPMSKVLWPWNILNEEMGGLMEDDYVVLYGRPKCVPLGTQTLQPDGSFRAIEDVETVLGFSHATHKLQPQHVTGRSEIVTKNIVRVTTQSGHELIVGEDHPVLRPDLSYTEAGKLTVGAFIGTVRNLEVGTEKGNPNTYELLGILAGDANYTRNEVVLTNQDQDVLDKTNKLLSEFSCCLRKRNGSKYGWGVVSEPHTKRNPVKRLLEQEKMHGKLSINKTVPESLFKQDKHCVAAFLGGLLSSDGGTYSKNLRWNTSSIEMAKQIKHLLLRLGVVGNLSRVTTNIGTDAYLVSVFAAEEQSKVLAYMAPYVAHEKKLTQLVRNTYRNSRGKYRDCIPKSPQLQAAIAEAKMRHGEWPKIWKHKYDKSKLFRRSGAISRRMLHKLAFCMAAPELLKWANSDVHWDKVTEVQELGPARCIDISVSGDHNLVVNDVITHNSMKSWVLAFIIAHFFMKGLRVLVYTKEMTPTNILRRVAAAAGGLPYQEMRFGRMMVQEKDTLLDIREMAQNLKHRDNLWCLSGKDTPGGGTGDTIPWLHTKVEKYKPDVVLIDGLYLMSTGKPNQKDNIRVQTISRECRQMVLDTGIPVVATAQANRGAAGHYEANLDEIAHSDAIGQDATAAFRVINEKTDHEVNGKKVNTVILATAGSREFRMDGFRIVAEPATDFSYHSPVSSKELETAKEKDSAPEDETKTKKRTPAKNNKQKEAEDRRERKLQEQLNRVKNN